MCCLIPLFMNHLGQYFLVKGINWVEKKDLHKLHELLGPQSCDSGQGRSASKYPGLQQLQADEADARQQDTGVPTQDVSFLFTPQLIAPFLEIPAAHLFCSPLPNKTV